MADSGPTGEITEYKRNTRELYINWKLLDFLTVCPNESCLRFYSPIFPFCDGRWSFHLNNHGTTACFKLHCTNFPRGNIPKTISLSVGLRGSNGVEKLDEKELKIIQSSPGCALQNFPPISELRNQKSRLMLENALVITCEMKISVRDAAIETDEDIREAHIDENEASENQATEELKKSLQSLLASKKDCDVTIKVKDKEFRAHRLILQARSPVFQAMFTHDMLEKQRGVVTMEDCDPETFPCFLDHVYTGNIKMISAKNVFDLYAASDKYDFIALKNECSKFLKRNLEVSCICDVITFAIRYNETELTELATEFFCSNSVDILETPAWQIFLSENPAVGNELFLKLLSKHGNIFRGSR